METFANKSFEICKSDCIVNIKRLNNFFTVP